MTKSIKQRKPLPAADYFPVSVTASVRKIKQAYRASRSDTTTEHILRDLVAFPSISTDINANRGAIKYVERKLKQLNMHTEFHEWDGRPALWATTIRNQKHPKIVLAAHMDVIPASKDMFSLKRDGNKYIGRGVMDMKGAIAAYLKALKNISEQLKFCDIGVLITSDEELGGQDGVNGVQRFLEAGYEPEFVILPDGGDNWKFEQASNGYIHFTLEASGRTAHSSRPWLGENAIVKLVRTLTAIQEHFPDQKPEVSTFNIGAIHGGEVANKIPDRASAEISLRPINQEELVRLSKLVEDICKANDVRAHTRAVFQSLRHSFDEPNLKSFLDTAETILGVRPTGMQSFAGSDARHFQDRNIPVAVFYPAGNGHHSDYEWIDASALSHMEQIITLHLQKEGRR